MGTEGVYIHNHDGVVSLFMNGGDASRWLAGRMRQVKTLAARTAPNGPARLGRHEKPHMKLRDGHGLTRTQYRKGPGAVQTLYNKADHALYVHEGTEGAVIRPLRGKALAIPKSSLFLYRLPEGDWGESDYIFPKSVAGQKSQPWMSKAARKVFSDVAHLPLDLG